MRRIIAPNLPHRLAGPVRIDRRTLLAGALAAGVATACGSGDSDADSDSDDAQIGSSDSARDDAAPDSADLAVDTFTVVQRYPVSQLVLVPGEVRLPHSLARQAELVSDGPTTLGAQVVDANGAAVGPRLLADRRDVTPSAYYVWRPTIEAPGIYSLVIDGGPADGARFQVFEPEEVSVPLAGEMLSGFDTPTVDDPGGVDPICTREPNCSFHSLTLNEALADDERGVAYFVGTPAFCQTGSCAPALEALIDAEAEFADRFIFVHAEVFTDLTATEVAPAVTAVGTDYEPALFITDRTGEIVERLDAIWDVTELRERLGTAQV